MYSAEQYIDTLAALENAWRPLPSTVAGCHTYLAGKVVSESRALARELGTAKFAKLLKQLNLVRVKKMRSGPESAWCRKCFA
jgi:hypothetical protein